MVKQELLQAVRNKVEGGTKAEAEKYLEAFQEVVLETLAKGEDILMSGFGSFKAERREAHESKNPKTGEAVSVPTRIAPKFKFSEGVKREFKTIKVD